MLFFVAFHSRKRPGTLHWLTRTRFQDSSVTTTTLKRTVCATISSRHAYMHREVDVFPQYKKKEDRECVGVNCCPNASCPEAQPGTSWVRQLRRLWAKPPPCSLERREFSAAYSECRLAWIGSPGERGCGRAWLERGTGDWCVDILRVLGRLRVWVFSFTHASRTRSLSEGWGRPIYMMITHMPYLKTMWRKEALLYQPKCKCDEPLQAISNY